MLGIGDVADRSVPLDDCVATVVRAMDAGLNVVDTAPGYEAGYSEDIVGHAVRGRGASRRDALFVIDKIDHSDRPVAPQVDASLQRLGLDHTDAFVFHGVSSMADWARLAVPGGPMDQLAEMVRAGKSRFRGISSHSPDVLRAALESGCCDVAMFPVGPFCDRRYVTEILPLARSRSVGTVCFKTFGAGKLLGDTIGYNQPLKERPRGKFGSGGAGTGKPRLPHLRVEECVHYTLTCDPDVALLGMSFPNEQDAAFAAARSFAPLSPRAMSDIEDRARRAIENKGPCWWNPDAGGL